MVTSQILRKGSHVHLIGICGTAMASLAGLYKQMGLIVTGSDENVYPPMSTQLASLGIEVKPGYRAENLVPRPQLVIIGNVISATNPEAQAVLESQIPYTSLPKAMGEYMIGERESLVVCGTHGKTTTTSLLAWIAQWAQVGAGFLVGGIPKDLGRSFQLPERNYFIIEGDEYDTAFFDKVPKFVHYRPRHVILTSIEFDHADIYRDLEQVKRAFVSLLELIPRQGTLVYSAEDPLIAELVGRCPAQKKISYGITQGDLQLRNWQLIGNEVEFDVFKYGAKVEKLRTQLFGEHNLRNILSAFTLASELGWPAEKIRKAVQSFSGVKRRAEILGEPRGVLVIEDFAHHPTAVRETLKAVHERFAGRRLFAIFEPRSATSRRKVFQKDFAQALAGAHTVLLPPAYKQEKISPDDRLSVDELAQDLKLSGTAVHQFAAVAEIVEYLQKSARPTDVVLIMSNGGFDDIYTQLLASLSQAVKEA